MSAILRLGNSSEQILDIASEKETLLNSLIESVKQCHNIFGGKSQLATEQDSLVSILLLRLEAVLDHGLKIINPPSVVDRAAKQLGFSSSKNEKPAFWNFIRRLLTQHELMRFNSLKSISTDIGRGRAWLRASLNEHTFDKYVGVILDSDQIPTYYEDYAFLLEKESAQILRQIASSLISILFALKIDSEDLDIQYTQSTIYVTDFTVMDDPQPVLRHESPVGNSDITVFTRRRHRLICKPSIPKSSTSTGRRGRKRTSATALSMPATLDHNVYHREYERDRRLQMKDSLNKLNESIPSNFLSQFSKGKSRMSTSESILCAVEYVETLEKESLQNKILLTELENHAEQLQNRLNSFIQRCASEGKLVLIDDIDEEDDVLPWSSITADAESNSLDNSCLFVDNPLNIEKVKQSPTKPYESDHHYCLMQTITVPSNKDYEDSNDVDVVDECIVYDDSPCIIEL